MPNFHTITVSRATHTLGNLVSHALLSAELVPFASYKTPHPLSERVQISLDSESPCESVRDACDVVLADLEALRTSAGLPSCDLSFLPSDGFQLEVSKGIIVRDMDTGGA